MKLRKLHIEDYKMFKDFDISFVDENDEPLPIVVLAGVNGSGKTTLLEAIFLKKLSNKNMHIQNIHNKLVLSIIKKIDNEEKKIKNKNFGLYFPPTEEQEEKKNYRKRLVYFPSGIDKVKRVADEFVKSFYFFLKEKDFRPSEVKEHFHNYMQEVFNGLDLTFKYSHLDRDDNVWFTNDNEEEFEINDLSTGEKTLLSKILYLYFLGYKDKIILIDEPELSLHPSWQNKVLKIYENFAKKNNCQIIIATHSPHIIGSAKNEYLRILRKGEEGNVEVVDNLMAYGRDIEWVLEEVMGTQYTREKKILEKIEACDTLINEEKFDEADNAIDALEAIIGEHDSEILTLRNSLAFERMDFEEDN